MHPHIHAYKACALPAFQPPFCKALIMQVVTNRVTVCYREHYQYSNNVSGSVVRLLLMACAARRRKLHWTQVSHENFTGRTNIVLGYVFPRSTHRRKELD